MNFGNKLYELRRSHKLSQKELANKLGFAQASIGYWEKEQRTPSIEAVKSIADFFHVSVNELYGIEEPDTIEERFKKACEWLEDAGFELSSPDQDDFFQKYSIDDSEHGTICKMDKIDLIDLIESCVNDADKIRDEIAIRYIKKAILKE